MANGLSGRRPTPTGENDSHTKDVIIYESQQNCHSRPHMCIVRGIGKPIAHGVWLHHIANHRTTGERIVHGVIYNHGSDMGVVDRQ